MKVTATILESLQELSWEAWKCSFCHTGCVSYSFLFRSRSSACTCVYRQHHLHSWGIILCSCLGVNRGPPVFKGPGICGLTLGNLVLVLGNLDVGGHPWGTIVHVISACGCCTQRCYLVSSPCHGPREGRRAATVSSMVWQCPRRGAP